MNVVKLCRCWRPGHLTAGVSGCQAVRHVPSRSPLLGCISNGRPPDASPQADTQHQIMIYEDSSTAAKTVALWCATSLWLQGLTLMLKAVHLQCFQHTRTEVSTRSSASQKGWHGLEASFRLCMACNLRYCLTWKT